MYNPRYCDGDDGRGVSILSKQWNFEAVICGIAIIINAAVGVVSVRKYLDHVVL
jgi:hypothetical protein